MYSRPQIRRVLILGHSGFIGGHLKRLFRERFREVEIVGKSAPEIDLTAEADARGLAPLFDERTAVIMCAGVKKQLGDSQETFSQNLDMALNFCKLLVKRPLARLIFFSSAAVYGEDVSHDTITEETSVHPTSYYGLAKYASERLLWKAVADRVVNSRGSLLILRPALVYGPGDDAGGYGPSSFLRAAVQGAPVTLWGDGTERREFIFIEDVAEIVLRLTFQDYQGVLNVVSGTSYSFREALGIAARLAGTSPVIQSRPRTKGRVDHRFDNAALLQAFPEMAFTGLEEGMKRMLDGELRAAGETATADRACFS